MSLFNDITLTDSIEIKATPERIFEFFTNLSEGENYRSWHPQDHVSFRWVKGNPWQVGSVVYAEEYIHGKLHKLKFIVTRVIPNKLIEYTPGNPILRFYCPKNTFAVDRKGDICVFTASGTYRVGWLAKTFAGKKVEYGLSSVRKHMKEEGENLKRMLEG